MKLKGGAVFNKISYVKQYTTTGLPNQKPKRVRHKKNETKPKTTIKFTVSVLGILASCLVFAYTPFPTWLKILLAIFLSFSLRLEAD